MNEILPRIDARGRRVGGQPSVVRVFNRTVSVGPSVAPRVKGGGGGVPARVILSDAKMQKGGLVRVVAAKPLAERLAEKKSESKPIPAEGKYAPAPIPEPLKVEEHPQEEVPAAAVEEPVAVDVEEQPLSATPEPLTPEPITETEENLTDLLEAAQETKPLADAVETEADAKSETLEVPNGVIIPELPESPKVEEKTDEVQPPEQPQQYMSRKKKRKKNRHNRYSMMAAEQGLL